MNTNGLRLKLTSWSLSSKKEVGMLFLKMFVPHSAMVRFVMISMRAWEHAMTTWTRRGGQKSLFLSTFRVKNVHVEVGGGQKSSKLCPRSH
jgi:hypothetical protein